MKPLEQARHEVLKAIAELWDDKLGAVEERLVTLKCLIEDAVAELRRVGEARGQAVAENEKAQKVIDDLRRRLEAEEA